jgi:hypothetical protein
MQPLVTAMNRMLFFSRILVLLRKSTSERPKRSSVDLRSLPPLAFGYSQSSRTCSSQRWSALDTPDIGPYPHGRSHSSEVARRESGDPNCLIPGGMSRPSGAGLRQKF